MISIDLIKNNLLNLPGYTAHSKVMSHRKPIHKLGDLPNSARQSAVLLLLYPKNNKIHIVFILRQTYKGVHSAQIGLPGGKVEKSDENLLATALREAHEELRIQKKNIEILGELTPLYVPPSNFIIHPFVAYQKTEPVFIPDSYEVSEVIECPLENLIKNEALIDAEVIVPTGKLNTKGFTVNKKILWGATAMITQELIDVIKQ